MLFSIVMCVSPAFICTRLNQPVRHSCAKLSASFTSAARLTYAPGIRRCSLLTRADSAFLAWRAQMQIKAMPRSISP